jgi:hypothetical protein
MLGTTRLLVSKVLQTYQVEALTLRHMLTIKRLAIRDNWAHTISRLTLMRTAGSHNGCCAPRAWIATGTCNRRWRSTTLLHERWLLCYQIRNWLAWHHAWSANVRPAWHHNRATHMAGLLWHELMSSRVGSKLSSHLRCHWAHRVWDTWLLEIHLRRLAHWGLVGDTNLMKTWRSERRCRLRWHHAMIIIRIEWMSLVLTIVHVQWWLSR